ncbi:MAG TPA: MCE family protein [Jatrophihabitans sp.]|jgi:virulence factor Mce-like protein|uniref:MCE family protein n=1 Tax=Jatrophihabitans sp. TaxID=1932789 RepID=UPI002E073B7B|nr:MCE family protein [Jatrophihabitans sp.]
MAKLPKSVTRIVTGVVVAAIVLGGVYFAFLRGSSDKTVTGEFASAVGVYPGTPVKILGVNVGQVDSVSPGGNGVKITMSYDSSYKLPKGVFGVLVANSLVSDRYVQLQPAYTGGAVLASGGTIAPDHTTSPAELDDIYKALNTLSVALGPNGANKGGPQKGALANLVNVAAANLKGNGAALGNSITQLSKAAQTLAAGRGDLFQTVGNLRKFTAALSSSDKQVRLFNEQLAQVAGDLANERADLGGALKQLGLALDDVNTFVKGNAGRFHTSIKGLEAITSILVKQKSSLNETLAIAPVALANIVHAYQPNLGVIATRSNLASLTDPSQLCALLKGGNLLGGLTLGPLTTQISSVCSGVLSKLPGGAPSLPNLDLTGLLTGGLGGLVGAGAP